MKPSGTHSYRILICDDDPDIVRALNIYLQDAGYETATAHTGRQALNQLVEVHFDLLLLDVMMPEINGISLLQQIRSCGNNMPIILISAKSEDEDIILGLNLGADDYITKPFNPREVIARIKSQLRRYTSLGARVEGREYYTTGGLALDHQTKTVTVDGEPVSLTSFEYNILYFLIRHKGQVFSSSEIYEAVWRVEPLNSENVVTVHICHIREKIEIDPRNPRYLKVLWGKGYRIEDLERDD